MRTLAFWLVALPLFSCASYQTLDLPRRPAHTFANRQVQHGFVMAAELLLEPEERAHQFGPQLQDLGYLPVLVFLENNGASSFEISRQHCELLLENGDRLGPTPPLTVYRQLQKSFVPVVFLGPLVLPPIALYRHLETYNHDLARDVFTKAFPASLRLQPGDPPQAFAFFFRDPDHRLQSEFLSSVLTARVEQEGRREAKSDSNAVGRTLTFTISLYTEGMR